MNNERRFNLQSSHPLRRSLPSSRERRTTRRGLTLIEVTLVLALVVVLAGLAIPVMKGPLLNQRLRSGGDMLQSDWSSSRVKAMETGLTYVFRCELGGRGYTLQAIVGPEYIDDSALVGLNEDTMSSTSEMSTPTLDPMDAVTKTLQRELPAGVFFADMVSRETGATLGYGNASIDVDDESYGYADSATLDQSLVEAEMSDDAQWSSPIYFYPDGTTSEAILLLKNENDFCVEIGLRGLTGMASLARPIRTDGYEGQLDSEVVFYEFE